jgi:Fe-S cluster assembly ATPase SufC
MADLQIRNLHVTAEGKQILKGLDLGCPRARSTP